MSLKQKIVFANDVDNMTHNIYESKMDENNFEKRIHVCIYAFVFNVPPSPVGKGLTIWLSCM